MVIQRFQSLFLLIATIMAGVFMFVPFGYGLVADADSIAVAEDFVAWQVWPVALPCAIGGLLSLIALFMFRNLNRQLGMVWISLLFQLIALAVVAVLLTIGKNMLTPDMEINSVSWSGNIFLLVGAAVLDYFAITRIKADRRLLKSIDRLR